MKCVHKISVSVRSNMLRILPKRKRTSMNLCVYLFTFALYIFLIYDAIATTD